MEPAVNNQTPEQKPAGTENPMFPFMGIGSLIYAFFYTLFLYKNGSGITYPFFVGGTCLYFFCYLKRSGATAKKFSVFITISLLLLGISTCLTDSWLLIFFNKLAIFFLFFYLMLHNLYEDKKWDLPKYFGAIINITCSSICYIFRPFSDFAAFSKNKKMSEEKPENKGKYIIFGIIIALPLLLIILFLLGSADAVFGNIVNSIFTFEINSNVFGISFLFFFAFFASYSIMCRISKHNIKEEIPDKRTAEPAVGITFTGIISFVYLIFCYIQIVYLFGGFGTLPEDYTYASYAREGFFQLVFVCLINLSLVLICVKRFRENRLLKGILTFISICTYIMIASSAYRMILYIQVYYLTFLRIFVLWALLVIFLLMTGAIIMIYNQNFPLVKYCLIVVTVFYLIFSFAHPDYWIARYNLERGASVSELIKAKDNGTYSSQTAFTDYTYLSGLSMDAAPVIFEKADELEYGTSDSNNCWFKRYASDIVKVSYGGGSPDLPVGNADIPKKLSIRNFNFSRWTAYSIYTRYYMEHDAFANYITSYIYDL